jgi:adenylate cyclase
VFGDSTRAKSGTPVAIDYDDRAARENQLGRWPWDRRIHAQVVEWLTEAGARAIVFDLLFEYPARDPAEDGSLAKASRRAGNVIYPFIFRPVRDRESRGAFGLSASRHIIQAEVQGTGEIPGAGELILPLDALVQTAGALGHILRTPDSDGVLRRIPLLYSVKGGFVPALALAAAFYHLDVDPGSVRIERGQAIRFRPRQGDEVVVPIDAHGRTWINYAGPWGQRFIHYPYSWLLAQVKTENSKALLSGWFKNRSVVVANLTTGSTDQGATPFERNFPFGEVHLHILNMLLTRQFVRDATPGEVGLCIVGPLVLLTGAALGGGPGLIVPTFTIVGGAYLVTLQRAFNNSGVLLPAVGPVLALTTGLVLLLTVRFFIVDRERLRFQSALGACLPPQTVQEVRRSPGRIRGLLAGRRRELTILFADIRGFSTFCQMADPLEIQRVLREYLTAMTEVLRAHGGTLDKYMGDGILAFFGDAEPDGGGDEIEEKRVERQAGNAVLAGLAMQRKMRELNALWRIQGREEHLIRIGINTGAVTVGNLGTEHLWDYTVVGAEVNKAQRLEGAAQPGGLLVSRRTYALARRQGILPDDLAPKVAVLKGIGEEGEVYPVPPELVALASFSGTSAQRRGHRLLRSRE